MTRKTELFEPENSKNVKMYTCGPSTYQLAHIGNYRTFLFEDVFQRYLEFLGYKVTRTMTLTDLEDKAIQQAKKEKLTVEELTAKNETICFKDFKLLRIKQPDYPIKASKSVDQSVQLISILLQKGYAYTYSYKGEKNIYFDPLKFKTFGKLSHIDMRKWPKKKRRFHKDTYPGTPWNMGDFVIWHGCHQTDHCYETSLGKGRPSWNIQDAAIVTKTLGFSIDVACGGIDNLVRHHDYTLAIAEAVSGRTFCRYWLHGAHLFVDGKKMSKSRGNVYYPYDLKERGFSGAQIRFFLIYSHYREPLNFTFEKIKETTQRLDSLRRMIRDLAEIKKSVENAKKEAFANRLIVDFENNMNDDLNVKAAFDCIYETIQKIYKKRFDLDVGEVKDILAKLRRIDTVFQCIF